MNLLEQGKIIQGLCVRILELGGFMCFLHLCFYEGCVDNLFVILKKGIICMGEGNNKMMFWQSELL